LVGQALTAACESRELFKNTSSHFTCLVDNRDCSGQSWKFLGLLIVLSESVLDFVVYLQQSLQTWECDLRSPVTIVELSLGRGALYGQLWSSSGVLDVNDRVHVQPQRYH
jgi:hypothetical protein